jgi:beta-glucosidase
MKTRDFFSFPKDFLWGACLSDYQHFGGAKCDLPPTWGAKHAFFYKEDFKFIKKLKLNAFRTGIEWARIEPKEDVIDKAAVEFYHDYFKALKKTGVKTFVTLHHFTNPPWIHDYGGWLSEHVVNKFIGYVDFVSFELGEYIDYYVVINEPAIYAINSYMTGEAGFPPYHKDISEALRCIENLTKAIANCYRVIHKNDSEARVGFSHFTPIILPEDPSNPENVEVCKAAEDMLLYTVPNSLKDCMDYFGVDYYLNIYISKDGSTVKSEINPEGLRHYLNEFYQRYKKPVAIIENGFPTRDEEMKIKFMLEHLRQVHDAIKEDSVKVFAYNWWSFLHGYEWGLGYKPFFALIDVDTDGTYERRITKTARVYAQICQQNGFTAQLYDVHHKLEKQRMFKVKPPSPFAFQT